MKKYVWVTDSDKGRVLRYDWPDLSNYRQFDGVAQYLQTSRTTIPVGSVWVPFNYEGGGVLPLGLVSGVCTDNEFVWIGGAEYVHKFLAEDDELRVLKTCTLPTSVYVKDICLANRTLYCTDGYVEHSGNASLPNVFAIDADTMSQKFSFKLDRTFVNTVYPQGIATDAREYVIVADAHNSRLCFHDLSGNWLFNIGSYSATDNRSGYFGTPCGVSFFGTYDLHVVDKAFNNILRYSTSQANTADYISRQSPSLTSPQLIKSDGSYLFVADAGADKVYVTNYPTASNSVYHVSIPTPQDLTDDMGIGVANNAYATDGDLIVVDRHGDATGNDRLVIWNREQLRPFRAWGGWGAASMTLPGLDAPTGVTNNKVDVASREVFLTDTDNKRILKLSWPDFEILDYYTEDATWDDWGAICSDGEYIYAINNHSNTTYMGSPKGMVQKIRCSDMAFMAGAYTTDPYDLSLIDCALYLYYPLGITTDGTHVYIGTHDDGQIIKLNCSDLSYVTCHNGRYTNNQGNGVEQHAKIVGMCNDGKILYYADEMNCRIQKRWLSDLSLIDTHGSYGYDAINEMMGPWGMDHDGEYLYFPDGGDVFDTVNLRKHRMDDLSFVTLAGYEAQTKTADLFAFRSQGWGVSYVPKHTIVPPGFGGGSIDPPSSYSVGSPPPAISITSGWIPFYMLELYMDSGDFYLSNADRPLYWESNTYACFPFQVGQATRNAGAFNEEVSVSVGNMDRGIAALVLGERVEGKQVTIRKSYWTRTFSHTPPYVYFAGQIDTVNIVEAEDSASVALGLKNEYWNWQRQLPNHEYSATCNWIFKSSTPGCQYTGQEKICDRSYERCTELGNTERFRGFRHMNEIMDNEIWWGKQRESSKKE